MTYDFWKKAGVVTAVIGAMGIAGATFAQTNTAQNIGNDLQQRPFVKSMMGKSQGLMGLRDNGAVQTAIENRDYDAFVTAITSENGQMPKILETITVENFGKFCDMHEAVKNQDFDTAKAIAEELGFPELGMRGPGNGMMLTDEQRQEIHEAIINGDYQTWFNLVAKDGELPEQWQTITADNFVRFSEMHKLLNQANDIREELGLKKPNQGFPGNGMMLHLRQGFGEQEGMHKGWGMKQ